MAAADGSGGTGFAGNGSRDALCSLGMEMPAIITDTAVQPTAGLGGRSSAAARRRASTNSFYDHNADGYAAATMRIDTAERIARFAALLPRGGRVLDAGCGAGRDLIGFEASGLRAEGLDISPSLAAIARRNSKLPVRIGDLRDPPYPPASFDGVWAMASLLHLEPGEVRDTLARLRDLLVPGGVLFASVKRGRGLAGDDDGRWFALQDERSWSRHLRAAGLEIIEVVGEPAAADGGTGSVAPGWISSLARRPR